MQRKVLEMEQAQLMEQLHTLNNNERFYRAYRLAKQSPIRFEDYLAHLDQEMLMREQLLVPEIPDTIPEEYKEQAFFAPDPRDSIYVMKHNCYTPPVPHCHSFYEFFYVLEGSCVHTIGGSSMLLRAGDCCLIQPGIYHSLDVSDESIVINILIRRSTFRDYFYSILQGDNALAEFFMSSLVNKEKIDYILFQTAQDHALRASVIDACQEFFQKDSYYSELTNAIVMRILILLLRHHMIDCKMPENRAADTRKAMTYINFLRTNPAEMTLTKAAEHFHYSPEYMSRTIHRTTGYTFSELLARLRIENACQYLRDTTISVADIGSLVGYETAEHFIRTFKKITGKTPREYRSSSQQHKSTAFR